jgi:uncharacterized protein (TIGR02996 family)
MRDPASYFAAMRWDAAILEAIRDDPADPAPQLVVADWLLEQGDPRGELIVLDHCERAGDLDDPAALERLLLLAAEYTFPCAREPDESTLPFIGGGGCPVQYELDWGGHHYYIRYRHEELSASIDDGAIETDVEYPVGYPDDFTYRRTGEWSDEETAATLAVFSDAIRYATPFAPLRFPHMRAAPPAYGGGARRVYRLPLPFTRSRGLPRDRYGLAARDYLRWNEICDRLSVIEHRRALVRDE